MPPGACCVRSANSVSPELACVVLSTGNPSTLIDAVASLHAQDEPVEIVVVHSGGGGAQASLAAAGFELKVVEIETRILPGAARNRGIAATSAPFISFLASDCVAERGWAETRLRAHRSGAVAVASAVTNPFRTNLPAWASYVALFNRRMPGVSVQLAQLYGASYARRLFEQHGYFSEDMRGGEDTDFHRRLAAAGVPIDWEPGVRTAHRHPTDLFALLRDQFRRGARSARAWEKLRGFGPLYVAVNAFRRLPSSARVAWYASPSEERRWIAASTLLLPVAAAAYAAGSIAHGLLRSGREEE
jgi:GT2 family glycosyltransferase